MAALTKRTDKIIDAIVEGLQIGRYENDLCVALGVCSRSLRRWKVADADLRERVNQARLDGILARLEADKLALEQAVGRDDILRAKECLAHSRWEAERLLKDFNPVQKQEVAHVGPMVFGWEKDAQVNKVISDADLDAATSDEVVN